MRLVVNATTGEVDEEDNSGDAVLPPQFVAMAQARLVMLAHGILDAVEAAINALPSPQKEAALIEWEYRSEVRRDSPLLAALQPIIGLSDAQIDAMFVEASAL